MSITAAELLVIGNERTGRSKVQTDVDKFIKSWVADLTTRGIILEAEENITLVDEQANYVEATYLTTNLFKQIKVITIIDSDGDESAPLREISWHRYKERVGQGDSPAKPKEFCRFNNTLYFWPAPDTDSYPTARVSGTIHHADSTTISYPDRFRECAIQYVIYKIYESLGKLYKDNTVAHFKLYEHERNKMMTAESNKRNHSVQYNDI